MGKFTNLTASVFSVFNSNTWKAENIVTVPSNFIGNTNGKFIRVNILPYGNSLNLVSKSGILIIDIFTAAGNGVNDSLTIADKLDSYLVGKSIAISTGITQFGSSSLDHGGIDSDNLSLFRSKYSIPFGYYLSF